MPITRTLGLLLAAALFITAAEAPSFDVTSVKTSAPNEQSNSNFPLGPGDVYIPNGGLFDAKALPAVTYIFFAWKFIGNQSQYLLPQLPEWTKSERFDIQAKASGNPGKDDMRLMMRSLLADRFKLAMHQEDREVPVLAFVFAKQGKMGPNLRAHTETPPCETKQAPGTAPQNTPDGLPALCNGIFGMPASVPGRQKAGARNVTLSFIADSLSGGAGLGRAMVNKTGLDTPVDFTLEWVPDRSQLPPGADFQLDTTGPTLQQALQDQLGIKLQSDKTTMKVWVLDHIEHPSAN